MGRNSLRIWGKAAVWLAPILISVGALPFVVHFLLAPKMDRFFLQEQEMSIQDVSQAVCWMLARYEQNERTGVLSHEEAQRRALTDLRGIRYGSEKKDYFWVSDTTPRVLMHPYQLDLEGKDVKNVTDPSGIHIFQEFARVALAQGAGKVEYTWQWKDDSSRMEHKVAFVRYFEPWGWVIGTGFYPCDLETRTSAVHAMLLIVSVAAALILLLASLPIAFRWLMTESLRMRLSEKVHRLEERYSDLLNALPCTVACVTSDGAIEFMNEAGLDRFGLSKDDLHGKRLADFVVHDDAEQVRKIERALQTVMSGSAVDAPVETRCVEKDGNPVWTAWFFTSRKEDKGEEPGFLCFGIDITSARLAEEAFRRERDLRGALVQCSMSYYISVGRDRRVLEMNQALQKALGCEGDETKTEGFLSRIFTFSDLAKLMSVIDELELPSCTDPIEWHGELRTSDSRLIPVMWRARTVADPDGKPEFFLISGTDTREMEKRDKDVDIRREELIQLGKMESLGILVSGVAHEINNPNQYIMTNASIVEAIWTGAMPILDEYAAEHGEFMLGGLKYSRVRDEFPELLSGIMAGVERIRDTVDALRRFARRPVAGLDDSIDLNSMVRSATTLVSNLIKKSTQQFHLELGADLPPVRGRFQELEQVVINLVCNACDLLPDRSSALNLATRHDTGARMVVIEVTAGDATLSSFNAVELSNEEANRWRLGDDRLWFWVSAQIVRDHGGTLDLSSRPGLGVVATVRIPASEEQD